jgi:glutaminyl-tRNA synthetase
LDSLGSKPPKGTLHWAGSDFIPGEVRVYDKLFSVEVPGKRLMPGIENDEIVDQLEDGGVDWLSQLNPRSLVVHQKALLEPLILDVAGAALTSRFQLQRLGYFTIDKDSNVQKPVLNRIVTLKESKELVALKNTDSKQFR